VAGGKPTVADWDTGGIVTVVMDYQKFIKRDRAVCGGEPVMHGTRVTLKTVLASLAEGCTPDEILSDFPTLMPEHIRAAIALRAAVRAS
jgi:uncharacterized protein (DUF433 family)